MHYDCQKLTFAQATTLVRSALRNLTPADAQKGQLHEIPVWYDESVGPELPTVAKRAGLSVEALIERHCSHDYCVFALGFAPGYGFMGLVDEAIATPRLKRPPPRGGRKRGHCRPANRHLPPAFAGRLEHSWQNGRAAFRARQTWRAAAAPGR
ncbi:hypothetical protein HAALTHF_14400n [Vreelandella aquamarina]|nr:hypothetical protein HAALTHF_14400n [Halomonas axialensis]